MRRVLRPALLEGRRFDPFVDRRMRVEEPADHWRRPFFGEILRAATTPGADERGGTAGQAQREANRRATRTLANRHELAPS